MAGGAARGLVHRQARVVEEVPTEKGKSVVARPGWRCVAPEPNEQRCDDPRPHGRRYGCTEKTVWPAQPLTQSPLSQSMPRVGYTVVHSAVSLGND